MASSFHHSRAFLAVALVAVLVVVLAAAGTVFITDDSRADTNEKWASYWTGPEQPEASAFWWTASDEVSPGALQETLTDPEANEARCQEAVRAGHEQHDPSPCGMGSRLAVYVHGSQTPNLMPLWVAFERLEFRARFTGYSWDPDRPFRILRNRLTGAGLSNEGAEAVAAQVEEGIEEIEILGLEAGPLQQRFYRLSRRAEWILGEHNAQRAIDLGNDALIARASLTRVEEVSRLREINRTNYREQVWMQATETLNARLSTEDWKYFRKYLLDQVIPVHYYRECEWRIPAAQPLAIFLRLLIALVLLVGLPLLWLFRSSRRGRGEARLCAAGTAWKGSSSR